MANQALEELIAYLEETAAKVRRLEAEGDSLLQAEGQQAFQAKLEEKAQLLAGLGEKAQKLVDGVGGGLGQEIARQLDQFSMSAGTALRIGSVFFMTALLYPEDHRPGEPNDLERFIGELKEKLQA